jgi:hypothetical protein
MKLTRLSASSNLASWRVNTYQRFLFFYFLMFIGLVFLFAGVLAAPSIEADSAAKFFFIFGCFLAGQNFFIVRALSRVESDLADLKRVNESADPDAAPGKDQKHGLLKALRGLPGS